SVVNSTQPIASSEMGRRLKRNSRQLIATAAEYTRGGNTSSSMISGASCTVGSPGTSATTMPIITSRIEGGIFSRAASSATPASTASSTSSIWMLWTMGCLRLYLRARRTTVRIVPNCTARRAQSLGGVRVSMQRDEQLAAHGAGAMLPEIDTLPGAQRKPPIRYRHGHLVADQQRTHVCSHVIGPLRIVREQGIRVGDQALREVRQVGTHVRIDVLGHAQAGTGVTQEQMAQPDRNAAR